MNDNHVQQIFVHYIEQFERINNSEHQEYYKWQIAKQFRDLMDEALKAPAEELSAKLFQVKKLTSNIIDSYTQPFHGLVKFAEREPETVRDMFKMLFSNTDGDIFKRQENVQEFIKKSHALRDKYYPDSYLYKEDMHSVTGYLFLYDPDHNYIYKATHALAFADCVEFYDDWGYGTAVKLPVYYRMCDELVAAIKASEELMKTDASRYEAGWGIDPSTLHPDTEKHILAFDLIYCCSTYGLFKGISFTRPKTQERQILQEKKEKANQYKKDLEFAKIEYEELEKTLNYIHTVYNVGTELKHKKFGQGVIKEKNDFQITVDFPEVGEKKLDLMTLIALNIVSLDIAGYEDNMSASIPLLKNRDGIKTQLRLAEKNFASYAQYIN